MEAHDAAEPGQPAGVDVEPAAADVEVDVGQTQMHVEVAASGAHMGGALAKRGGEGRFAVVAFCEVVDRGGIDAGGQACERGGRVVGGVVQVDAAGFGEEGGQRGVWGEIEPAGEAGKLAPAGVRLGHEPGNRTVSFAPRMSNGGGVDFARPGPNGISPA